MSPYNKPAEYTPSLLEFIHEGVEIRNPFFSPDGTTMVDPVGFYGFVQFHTGGGCIALWLQLPSGLYLTLTDDSGCDIPEPEEWKDALYGLYDREEGIDHACWTLGDVPMNDGKPYQGGQHAQS